MKTVESLQLLIAFADSPKGSMVELPDGVPKGNSYLQLIAKARKKTDPTTVPAGPSESLLEEVASPSNLAAALIHVARNQGAPGVDGKTVQEVVAAAHRLLPRLHRDLLSGHYAPGDVRRVWIPKPGGGQRDLGIPNVVDRWVSQAVLQVLAPVFEPNFHNSSHGFRPFRGAGTAIEEAKGYAAEGLTWVVGIDLSKFFDRVNHQRLLARLAQRVKDPRVLGLVHQMLKARVVLPDGTKVNTEEGTPQGGPLSPLLSNIVLDELDQEMARRGLRFVRYADDFNVYVATERAGLRVMASLTRFIEGRLRLQVNNEKSEVATLEQIHFLGFSLVAGEEQVEVRLSKRSQMRLALKIRELTPRTWGQSLDVLFERANQYLRGWSGYFRLCTRRGTFYFEQFDAHLRRRIRTIIVRQKKKPATLFRHLKARGVSKKAAAAIAWSSRGLWHKSRSKGMELAYPNRWFKGRLTSLVDEWRRANQPPTVTGQQLVLF